jgi:hypothetical protein
MSIVGLQRGLGLLALCPVFSIHAADERPHVLLRGHAYRLAYRAKEFMLEVGNWHASTCSGVICGG